MSYVPPGEGGSTPSDAVAPEYPVAPAYPGGAQAYEPQQLGPAPGYQYAGFGSRFLGYLIDSLLLFAVLMIVYVPFLIIPIVQYYQVHPISRGQTPTALPADLTGRAVLLSLLGAVLGAAYFGGLVAWQGHTLGQRAIGMQVVRVEDGGKLPVGRSLARSAIFWVPALLGVVQYLGSAAQLLAVIGLIAVAWDSRKQGWHDKLGRSLVVKRVAVPPGHS